jgi:hypothetical protein
MHFLSSQSHSQENLIYYRRYDIYYSPILIDVRFYLELRIENLKLNTNRRELLDNNMDVSNIKVMLQYLSQNRHQIIFFSILIHCMNYYIQTLHIYSF